MNEGRLPNRHGSRFGDRTFAVLFGAAYLALLINLPGQCCPRQMLLVFAVGTIYALIGTLGFALVERGPLARALLYFAVQLLLGVVIARLTYADTGAILLLLLLCGQSVRVLRQRWLVGVCAMLVTAILLLAPPGNISWLEGVQTGSGLGAAAIFMIAFARLVDDEQRQRAELDLANRWLREYAAQAEELATIQERNRLAREIHDGLGHSLTVINMQIQGALAVLTQDRARAEQILARAQECARAALADVRHSVSALRTAPSERRPLPEALATLVEESDAAGLRTSLVVAGTPRPLSPQTELALYRAAQEGLTNVRRHARATRADVALDYRDAATVGLEVRDDGVGAASTDGGFGLLGLRERVQLLGGAFAVQTTPGHGLRLRVELPG